MINYAVDDIKNSDQINETFNVISDTIDGLSTDWEMENMVRKLLADPHPVGSYWKQYPARLTNDWVDAFPKHEEPEAIWPGTQWKLMQYTDCSYRANSDVLYQQWRQHPSSGALEGWKGETDGKYVPPKDETLFFDQYKIKTEDYKTQQDYDELAAALTALEVAFDALQAALITQIGSVLAECVAWSVYMGAEIAATAIFIAAETAYGVALAAAATTVSTTAAPAGGAVFGYSRFAQLMQSLRQYFTEITYSVKDLTTSMTYWTTDLVPTIIVMDVLLGTLTGAVGAMTGMLTALIEAIKNPKGRLKFEMDGMNSNLSTLGEATDSHPKNIRFKIWKRLK